MQTKVDKQIYNEEAERMLIGCLLNGENNQEMADDVFSKITAEDFANYEHRQIYTAMKLLWSKGKEVELVTIMETIERMFPDKKCDLYLSKMIDINSGFISAVRYESYAKILREYSALRSLKTVFAQAEAQINEMTASSKIIGDVQERLNEHEEQRESGKRVEHISVSAKEEADRIRKIAEGEYDDFGLETGFAVLDRNLWGLQKSDLIIVGARAGVGKTAFALNILAHTANKKKANSLFFSLEMPKRQIVRRLISIMSGIPGQVLNEGREGNKAKINEVIRELERGGLYIDDTTNISVGEMSSKAKRMQRKNGLDLIIVDYLQFVKPSSRSGNRFQDVGEIARDLKIMARQLNVPVIALCQLNRGLDTAERQPALSDLRESGEIENNADIIMFLNPTEKGYKDGARSIELIIGKFRNGAQKIIKMKYDGSLFKFRELEKRTEQHKQVGIEDMDDLEEMTDAEDNLPF